MNDFLTGLIGAELTLLGVSNMPAATLAPHPHPSRTSDPVSAQRTEDGGTETPAEQSSPVHFTQRDYRTAGC